MNEIVEMNKPYELMFDNHFPFCCILAITCDLPPALQFGQVTLYSNAINGIATHTCLPNYGFSDGSTQEVNVTCYADGLWEQVDPVLSCEGEKVMWVFVFIFLCVMLFFSLCFFFLNLWKKNLAMSLKKIA